MKTGYICHLSDIPEGSARGFGVADNDKKQELIVVRWKGEVRAFRNSCPHTGVNLEWMPDKFFNYDNTFLQCSTHGALFRPEDGYCIAGPCANQSLEQIPITVIKECIYFAQKV